MLMKWLEGQFIDFDVAHVGHEYKWRNLGEELGRARVTKRAEDNREAERAGRMGEEDDGDGGADWEEITREDGKIAGKGPRRTFQGTSRGGHGRHFGSRSKTPRV